MRVVGGNQYRRRWSVQQPSRRSKRGIIGLSLPVICVAVALAVGLYVFGFVGPRGNAAMPTAVPPLVPPPAPLAMPAPVGAFEPFGTLPPVAPAASTGVSPTLTYRLSGALTGGAPRADVYQIAWSAPNTAQVDGMARTFGITGPVLQTKPGVFLVEGNGRLTVDAKAMVYAPPAAAIGAEPLPEDRAAIGAARNWLGARNLMPPDAGAADVQRRGDTLDVIFHPKSLPDILSATPGVRVRMAAGGVVTEMERAWPRELQPGAYDLIALDEAWAQAPARGMVAVYPPAGVAVPADATAIIKNVSLAYMTGTNAKGVDYLQPVYVFSGAVALPNQPTGAAVRLIVPAVRNMQQ